MEFVISLNSKVNISFKFKNKISCSSPKAIPGYSQSGCGSINSSLMLPDDYKEKKLD